MQLEQILASDCIRAREVEDECARVEQCGGRRRLVGAIELSKGRMSRFWEGSGGTQPFINLLILSTQSGGDPS